MLVGLLLHISFLLPSGLLLHCPWRRNLTQDKEDPWRQWDPQMELLGCWGHLETCQLVFKSPALNIYKNCVMFHASLLSRFVALMKSTTRRSALVLPGFQVSLSTMGLQVLLYIPAALHHPSHSWCWKLQKAANGEGIKSTLFETLFSQLLFFASAKGMKSQSHYLISE